MLTDALRTEGASGRGSPHWSTRNWAATDEQAVRNAAAKVVQENIGLGDELLDDLFPLGGLKVNLDAFLTNAGMRLGVTAPRWHILTHHILGKCP